MLSGFLGDWEFNVRSTILMAALIVFFAESPLRADDEPASRYSRWNYWTPTLVRVRAHFLPTTVPSYADDRYPEIPKSAAIVVYPRPAATPDAYYRGTGMSYDPYGRFAVFPPVDGRSRE